MSSGNADTAFVSNCDHDYNSMARIQSTVWCSNVSVNVLHSIMELMVLQIFTYNTNLSRSLYGRVLSHLLPLFTGKDCTRST